jgi:RES domain-containing protein
VTAHAWRIVKARYAADAFTGAGAEKFGGRWNRPGVAVVYAAGSASLAMLEMLVHLEAHEFLKRYVSFQVSFDERFVTSIDATDLPNNWRKSPPPVAVQAIGNDWIATSRAAVLRVPSVIVPAEWNYLLNPQHPDFKKIEISPKEPVRFDRRLIKIRT